MKFKLPKIPVTVELIWFVMIFTLIAAAWTAASGAIFPTVILGANVLLLSDALNKTHNRGKEPKKVQGNRKVDIKATMKSWAKKHKDDKDDNNGK